jgi:hypothetical protein
MKTSNLTSLVIAFVILSSTAFAGNPKTEMKDTSIDSSEELYVNPLEEVLAMQGIPEIILDEEITLSFWAMGTSKEDDTNPLREVLDMEPIPDITLTTNQKTFDFEVLADNFTNPLQEVLEMESIPTIDPTALGDVETYEFDLLNVDYTNPLQEVLDMEDIPAIDLKTGSNQLTLK